jgi:hypothetical protein
MGCYWCVTEWEREWERKGETGKGEAEVEECAGEGGDGEEVSKEGAREDGVGRGEEVEGGQGDEEEDVQVKGDCEGRVRVEEDKDVMMTGHLSGVDSSAWSGLDGMWMHNNEGSRAGGGGASVPAWQRWRGAADAVFDQHQAGPKTPALAMP